MKKWKIIIIVLCTVVSNSLWAQIQGTDGVSFSSWLRESSSDFNEQNTKAILLKIDQIVARNCTGISASSAIFAIYPEFVITKSDIINTGMKATHVIRAEVSFFAVNKVDMGTYGNVTLQLQGNGNSSNDCIRSIINQIRVTDPKLAKFIITAKERVVEYYNASLPTMITRANSLTQRKQFEDALVLLSTIPECVDNYDVVAKKMGEIYTVVIDQNAKTSIHQAKSLLALKDYEAALGALINVDPTSNLFGQAEDIVQNITATVDNNEKAKIEQQLQLYNDQKVEREKAGNNALELEKMRIEASKKVGVEQAKAQAKEAEASGAGAISKWFLGKFK